MASIDEIQLFLNPLRINVDSELEDHFLIGVSDNSFYILKSEIDNYISVQENIVSEPETSIFYR